MNFASDNTTGAAPEILDALRDGNDGQTMPYGDDDMTRAVEQTITEIFERPCQVFLVATGSAANALALSAVCPPFGAILCHAESHVQVHECGAPELFTGGAKLIPLGGAEGKLDPFKATRAAERGKGDVHWVQPSVISITNLTEVGTCYTPSEIGALSAVCRRHGLALHMDGARFANALVSQNCSPAELTWKVGVDVLSFGATKNGALGCEAVVFFDPDMAADFGYRRKRGGHLFSKMRALSLQMAAYLKDDLWLRNARHANSMAQRLADGLADVDGIDITLPVEGNQVYPRLPRGPLEGLRSDGARFYQRDEEGVVRLVTAFNTSPEAVDLFVATARKHTGPVQL